MINMAVCVVFRSKWMTHSFVGSKHITHGAVTQILWHENKVPSGIHRRLLAFCAQDTEDKSTSRRWVRKSRDSGGNVDLNDQPRSGRPVTISSQCATLCYKSTTAFCYMRTYIHAYIHTWIHICIHACMHIYIHTHVHSTYIHTYIHTHTHIHTYIHTHTHLHAYICSFSSTKIYI